MLIELLRYEAHLADEPTRARRRHVPGRPVVGRWPLWMPSTVDRR